MLHQFEAYGCDWKIERVDGDNNCYWRTISRLRYGNQSFWSLVKAEHAIWYRYVTSQDRQHMHPRSTLYTSDNLEAKQQLKGCLEKVGAWTSALMAQVTADLYDWQIFVFSWNSEKGWHVTAVRGCLNSRQVFIGFMSTSNDPTTGTKNHWQPIFPLAKLYQLSLRDSEYRAHPPVYNTCSFNDFESLIQSDNPIFPDSSFKTPEQTIDNRQLLVMGGHRRIPGPYNDSIFAGDLGYITSMSRTGHILSSSKTYSSQREVPERLIPPAMCFVTPQLTMADVREHVGTVGFQKDTELAILAFLKERPSPLALQSQPSNTTPLVKADSSSYLMNPALVHLLQKEGIAEPFSPDLFESDTLLKTMMVDGRVQEYAEMLYLYTTGGSLSST